MSDIQNISVGRILERDWLLISEREDRYRKTPDAKDQIRLHFTLGGAAPRIASRLT